MDYTAVFNTVYNKANLMSVPPVPSLEGLSFLLPDLNTLLQNEIKGSVYAPESVLQNLSVLSAQDELAKQNLANAEKLVKTEQLLKNAFQEAQTGKYGLLADLLKVHPINEEALKSMGTATSILGARMTQINGQPALMDSSGLLWSLLGAGAGYVLGGPIGSVVGGLLGSSVGGVVSDVVSGVGDVVSGVFDTIGDIVGGIF